MELSILAFALLVNIADGHELTIVGALADAGEFLCQVGATPAYTDHRHIDAIVSAQHSARRCGFWWPCGEGFGGDPERRADARSLFHEISAIDGWMVLSHVGYLSFCPRLDAELNSTLLVLGREGKVPKLQDQEARSLGGYYESNPCHLFGFDGRPVSWRVCHEEIRPGNRRSHSNQGRSGSPTSEHARHPN